MDQVTTARDGRTVVIDRDVGDVARQICEIDESLLLRWHDLPGGSYYSVIQRLPDGQEQLVATCQPIAGGSPHPKLVDEIRKLASSSYDIEHELRTLHAQEIRDREHRRREIVGAGAERAFHEFKRRTGVQNRVFVPRGVR